MTRKTLLSIISVLSFLVLPAIAMAAMGEAVGTIEGLNCVSGEMKNCPADNMDPHLALEPGFVVMDEKGGHLLITGVDRSVLARNIHAKVKVKGTINTNYKTIKATSITSMSGKMMEIWSRAAEDKERERMMAP